MLWHPECLKNLRAEVESHLQPGAEPMGCRVCDRLVFLYRRKLHTGMALSLITFYRQHLREHGSPCDYRQHLHNGASRDHGYLLDWDLARAVDSYDGEELPKGFYEITRHGVRFVEEKISVPKYIYSYNDQLRLVSDEKTDIRTALGDKFDLDELLRDNRDA